MQSGASFLHQARWRQLTCSRQNHKHLFLGDRCQVPSGQTYTSLSLQQGVVCRATIASMMDQLVDWPMLVAANEQGSDTSTS